MIRRGKIEKLAKERIDELDNGLFIVEITISRGNQILVELEAEEGHVSIQDCVSVSRNIEHNLDREVEDFELKVSSAGLTEPFRVFQQYKKNIGNAVKVRLKAKNESLEGKLIAADKEGIIVETTSKERVEGKKKKVIVVNENTYNYDEIKETKVVISFKK